MKYISSGEGKMPLLTLVAILSISLTVNLPGLAIAPLEGKLAQVFPHVSHLQIQLLQVLPNVVIIPFILLSGKICTQRNQIGVLVTGLLIYILSGVAYLFADSMTMLIILGCTLGVGCGLLIPLAASLISQYFCGRERGINLGRKSGLSNFAVILGTVFVGWMAERSWHMSFLIYLVPLLPLALTPFLTNRFVRRYRQVTATRTVEQPAMQPAQHTFKRPLKTLAALIGVYVLATYGVTVVSYYIPFKMAHYDMTTAEAGVATAMFFMGAATSGFGLGYVEKLFGRTTVQVSVAVVTLGLVGLAVFRTDIMLVLCVLLVGLGYGVLQPVIYNKTTAIAPTRADSTRYFAYLLTGNYIGIALVPFIVDGARALFHAQESLNFPYVFNAAVMGIMLVASLVKSRAFVFSTDKPAD